MFYLKIFGLDYENGRKRFLLISRIHLEVERCKNEITFENIAERVDTCVFAFFRVSDFIAALTFSINESFKVVNWTVSTTSWQQCRGGGATNERRLKT